MSTQKVLVLSAKIPQGKGMYVWIADDKDLFGGDFTALANRAIELGLSWVAIKIADGIFPYNRRPIKNLLGITTGWDDTLLSDFVSAFHKVGVEVWGWQYIYCTRYPLQEAQIAVERIKKFGMVGLLLDPEAEAKEAGAASTRIYCNAVRVGLGMNIPVGLSSYRFPSYHPELAWKEWLKLADFHCPQVYWVGSHNPVEQLKKSYAELTAMQKMPFIPVGALYQEAGWKPNQVEVDAFDVACHQMNLPGIIWWEWANARRYQMEKWVMSHIWDTSYPLPTIPVPIPVPVPVPAPTDYRTIYWYVWVYPSADAPRATAGIILVKGTAVQILEIRAGRAHVAGHGWVEAVTVEKMK
jgi:hypothetical protein